jgi:hypothetical protein
VPQYVPFLYFPEQVRTRLNREARSVYIEVLALFAAGKYGAAVIQSLSVLSVTNYAHGFWGDWPMPTFTGKSINMNIQEALDDAMRQARMVTSEAEHHLVTKVEVTRIYAERVEKAAFHTLQVDIEAS